MFILPVFFPVPVREINLQNSALYPITRRSSKPGLRKNNKIPRISKEVDGFDLLGKIKSFSGSLIQNIKRTLNIQR